MYEEISFCSCNCGCSLFTTNELCNFCKRDKHRAVDDKHTLEFHGAKYDRQI